MKMIHCWGLFEMCGITGIYRAGGLHEVDRAAMPDMLAAIHHRGPDEEGTHFTDNVALGCRRLSIIDLAEGQQPMFANNHQVAMVANAEIYNHQPLRNCLTQQGACFQNQCDVEVLPHLYVRDGLDLANDLNGQFAFAIYDSERNRLVLGRDQTGIAPLFWTKVQGGIVFGSEIKAILAHPAIPRRLDISGLDQVLTFPGLVSPRTMFDGIHAVRPGHLLVVEGESIYEKQYWDYDFPLSNEVSAATEEQLLDELEEALLGAVKRRLVADVPVGLYVSGGLDSALIAAMAHKLEPSSMRHSYAVSFPGQSFDESHWQRIVHQQTGTTHHTVAFGDDDILYNLKATVWAGETALKESYNTCTLALARKVAEQNMRVVLTGEGADELFGGYVGHRLDATRMNNFDDIEAIIEGETRGLLWGDDTLFYERDYAAHADLTLALLSEPLRAQRAAFGAHTKSPVNIDQLRGRSRFHQRSYLDLKLRLPDHLLADHSDRVAYAASVEARYPFLDPEVVNVARRIPPSLMLKGGEEKYMLKQLGRRYLPSEICERRKFSFVAQGTPHLLRKRPDWVMDILALDRVTRHGVFDPDTVSYLKTKYSEPGFDFSQTFEDDFLMVVLTTHLLMETFDLVTP